MNKHKGSKYSVDIVDEKYRRINDEGICPQCSLASLETIGRHAYIICSNEKCNFIMDGCYGDIEEDDRKLYDNPKKQKNSPKIIYKLINLNDYVSEEQAVFIKIAMDIDTLVNTLGAIELKCEQLIHNGITVEEHHYVDFLKKYYNAQDVTKQYQPLLADTKIDKEDRCLAMNINFTAGEEVFLTIIQIDLFEARESCCGPGYEDLMEKYLPKSEELERDIINLTPYFLEHTGGSII